MDIVQDIYDKTLNLFNEITQIPRCSKHEEKIREWVKNKATEYGLNFKEDKIGNIIIYVPATNSDFDKSSQSYILQGHMDMVCNKLENSNHDFTKDPIQTYTEDNWLKAKETTLGADNGIAIAMSFAIATSNIKHGPLELLFTVDEETGLTGASALEEGILKGLNLINVDSEDEGVITIGCAGSVDIKISKKYQEKAINQDGIQINIQGGKGGHSGVDIHKKIANTNILIARILNKLEPLDVQISEIKGGTAHNGITGTTKASIYVKNIEEAKKIIEEMKSIIKNEYGTVEPKLDITYETVNISKAINQTDSQEIIKTMLFIPHGILTMSGDVKGLVETSNNFAIIKVVNGKAEFISMARSSINTQRDFVINLMKLIANNINAKFETGSKTSAWKPNPNSKLLERAVNKFKQLTDKEPNVEAIHAGLECAAIGSKHQGMEMISIGPTIKNAHTPKEMLYLPSVKTTIKWILEIIQPG